MLGVSLKISVTKILHHETDVNENYPKLRTVHKAFSYKHPATRQQGRAGSGGGGAREYGGVSITATSAANIPKIQVTLPALPNCFQKVLYCPVILQKLYLHCIPLSCEISFTELEATFLVGLSTIYKTTVDLESMNSMNFLLLSVL